MVATKSKSKSKTSSGHGLDVGDRVIAGRKSKRAGVVKSATRTKVMIEWEGYEPTSYTKSELETYLIQKAEGDPVPSKQEEVAPKVTASDRASEKEAVTRLPLAKIRTDGGTQPRAELNQAVVEEYAAEKREGAAFPPATVFFDGTDYWLADGFHRFNADKLNEAETVEAIVKQGTRRDAILYSVGANASHGLRRSNADKRRAVMRLLEDEEWGRLSNNKIAQLCGVSLDLVNRLRDESSLNDSLSDARTYTTKHGTTATMNTSRIGKSSSGSGGGGSRTILGLRTDREQLLPSIPPNSDAPPDSEPKLQQWQPGDWVRANQVGAEAFQKWAGEQPIKITTADNPNGDRIHIIWLQRSDGEFYSAWSNWVDSAEPVLEEAPKSPAADLPEQQSTAKTTFDPHGNSEERTDEHYTPKYVWELALKCFESEQFDLDPCSNSHVSPNIPSAIRFTQEDDGLAQEWNAVNLWMNPPYSDTKEWVKKLIAEYEAGHVGEAIALVKGDFSTKWFQLLLEYPICLVNHRIKFINDENDGNSAKFASAIVYLGPEIAKFYQTFDVRYSLTGIGIVVQAGVRGVHFGE